MNIITSITSMIADLVSSLYGFADVMIPAEVMEPAQDVFGNALTEIAPYWNEVWDGFVNMML